MHTHSFAKHEMVCQHNSNICDQFLLLTPIGVKKEGLFTLVAGAIKSEDVMLIFQEGIYLTLEKEDGCMIDLLSFWIRSKYGC